jgi:hypothetical protein
MHLDAVQGSGEAWNEAYNLVRRVSTGADNAVMRQEHRQSSWLCQEAGRCGA